VRQKAFLTARRGKSSLDLLRVSNNIRVRFYFLPESDQVSSEFGNSGMKNRIKWCDLAYEKYLKKDVKKSKSKIPSTEGVRLEFKYEKHTVMEIDVVACPSEKNFYIRESVFKRCMYVLKKPMFSKFFHLEDEVCVSGPFP
jgi:hypothetical protein